MPILNMKEVAALVMLSHKTKQTLSMSQTAYSPPNTCLNATFTDLQTANAYYYAYLGAWKFCEASKTATMKIENQLNVIGNMKTAWKYH